MAGTEIDKTLTERLREAPYFILPNGDNCEAIRAMGRQFLDLTIEALCSAQKRPPLPTGHGAPDPIPPAYEPPLQGRSAEELIAAVREQVISRALNVSHPGYVGHMDTLASAIGAFSDVLVSALNNNMLCWEMSPVFTEMEARFLAWIASAIGWPRPPAAVGSTEPIPTGFLVSGGSLANLSAILAARNVMAGPGIREEGLSATPGPPVIFASEEAHYSIDKIANILGFGARGLVRIPTDDALRMRPAALEDAIADARAQGRWPFCIVGIGGTTVSGSIDPLQEIGEIAQRHGIWFHVDAAYGGSLLITEGERCRIARERLNGIALADSVTFNPQKWLFVPKVCAGVFFRDSRRVAEAVRQTFPYAGPSSAGIDDPRRNVGEYTIQGTRRVDILKLWLTFEHLGRDLLGDLMQETLHRARTLAERIAEEPCCELLTKPQLNIVCFRYVPEDWDPAERAADLNRLNEQIHAELTREGLGWISIPRHRGVRWLRFVILHPLADDARLAEILESVLDTGQRLVAAPHEPQRQIDPCFRSPDSPEG